jgi:hypothetical protein
MLIDLPIIQKDRPAESYVINVNNINYMRKWVGAKGELQTVIYFNSTEKYIVVDKPIKTVSEIVMNKMIRLG